MECLVALPRSYFGSIKFCLGLSDCFIYFSTEHGNYNSSTQSVSQFRHCCRPTVSESQVLSRIAMKAAQADNRILAVGSALSDRIQPRNSTTPEAAEMDISLAVVTAGHTHL
mgnify:FL=1